MDKIASIISQFYIYGDLISYKAFGNGHINNTYVSTFNQGGILVRYTHQRINKVVFKNPMHVMENICATTNHIRQKFILDGEKNASRRTLTVIPTKAGENFFCDEDGDFWRTYIFIESVKTFEMLNDTNLAHKVGKAIGEFQKQLSDYKGKRLNETISNFHNMQWRYEQFEVALKKDVKNRAARVQNEIDFLEKNRARAMILTEGLASGKLQEGITHNDTKLNNILFDEQTGDAICIIDLDTVMPGTVLFDTGDLIRTAAMTAEEDETDLSKIYFNFTIFKSLIEGYMTSAKDFLTNYEISLLAESGRVIAHIMAVRFLTDYLNGDVYYKIDRTEHNLDRFRTQKKLIESMDEQWQKIESFLHTF